MVAAGWCLFGDAANKKSPVTFWRDRGSQRWRNTKHDRSTGPSADSYQPIPYCATGFLVPA